MNTRKAKPSDIKIGAKVIVQIDGFAPSEVETIRKRLDEPEMRKQLKVKNKARRVGIETKEQYKDYRRIMKLYAKRGWVTLI